VTVRSVEVIGVWTCQYDRFGRSTWTRVVRVSHLCISISSTRSLNAENVTMES